jgi:beta-xylosidase
VQNTGHADIVQAKDGKWWGVALGVRPQGADDDELRLSREQLGRETFLFPVQWVDGWPVFNNGRTLSEVVLSHQNSDGNDEEVITSGATSNETTKKPGSEPFYNNDFFKSRTLDQSFYFLRTPYSPFYTISSATALELRPNAYAIGDRDSPAMILRKQTSHQEIFETELEFSKPRTRLEEAGISIFYGDFLHNEIGVAGGEGGGRSVVVRTVTLNHQVGPWALTTGNATVTNVGILCLSVLVVRLLTCYVP